MRRLRRLCRLGNLPNPGNLRLAERGGHARLIAVLLDEKGELIEAVNVAPCV